LGAGGVAYGDDPPKQDQYGTQPSHPSKTSDYNTETTAPGQPTRFNKASKLIGMEVQNQDGQRLGDVKDIVINLDKGTVSYAVLSSGGVLGVGEKLLAVPLNAFTRSADEKHLVLNATRENITQAESLGNNWPSVQNPNFGAMPFWQQKSSMPRGTENPPPPSH